MVETTQSAGSRAPQFRAAIDGWTVGAMAMAALLLLPVAAVAWLAFFPTENIWPHLVEHALPVYLGNTIVLMAIVGLTAAMIGTGAAWLVTMTEFPGRRWLEWALLAAGKFFLVVMS